jgi:hypothetical protein
MNKFIFFKSKFVIQMFNCLQFNSNLIDAENEILFRNSI